MGDTAKEKGCLSERGNFACAVQKGLLPGFDMDYKDFDGCTLTGTKEECENVMDGEWCVNLDDQKCAKGRYDEEGSDADYEDCKDGCDWQTCEDAIKDKPPHAVGHCYTESQLKDGITWPARGCNYGSDDNTCAYDENGRCMPQKASSVTV